MLGLVDRLRAAAGARVSVRVHGIGVVEGTLAEVGVEWLLLLEAPGREVLVPSAAVLGVTGLGRASAAPGSGGRVFERLGLGSALRGIARDRSPVTLWLTDSSTVTGLVDRVGADFLELSGSGLEERRTGDLLPVRAVPFRALAALRRQV